MIPGGFGERGAQGKINAIQFARERDIPCLSICYGMQLAVIEAARNLAHIKDAKSSEFEKPGTVVVGLMTEWNKGNERLSRSQEGDLGGTMRLGSYPAMLKSGTAIYEIYGQANIEERHRHRYEVNLDFKEKLEQAGMIFSGLSPDGFLPETIEYKDHPWFIGVQYHPELRSQPLKPHPLFASFVDAAVKQSRLV